MSVRGISERYYYLQTLITVKKMINTLEVHLPPMVNYTGNFLLGLTTKAHRALLLQGREL